ncbi:hypothetical protein [Alkalibacillus aidingensis]|uniref:hypothetical protein n=1 Tax=Alkalibacillus aidingensis TaxID=2747607 RepID=UPI0016611DD2|nr:hypothetical protein [Alkalibacillus aidingensis]
MSTIRFMYLIGIVSLASIVLYFLTSLDHYSWGDAIQGLAFFGASGVFYFVFVYWYHKSDVGKTATISVLGLIALVSVVLIFLG